MNGIDGSALAGYYDYWLVALSIAIAILASYATLDLSGRMTVAHGKVRLAWLSGGAFAMGIGIWSMHYMGMAAMQLPVPVRYDWPTVLVSMVAAVLASAVALFVVTQSGLTMGAAIAGSLLMGGGIASMHYIGMHAMRMAAMCVYSGRIVALSVLLGMVISFVAIRLTFAVRGQGSPWGWRKSGSAILMGLAIPVMHYVGMTAVTFVSAPLQNSALKHSIDISNLGLAGIVFGTLLILLLVFVTAAIDRRFSLHALELQLSEQHFLMKEEMNRAQEKMKIAEAGSRAKSQFLANMSHEIRTPLNGILGMTDLALETKMTAEQREYIGTVKLSADALLTVINDILDFSKIEAGKVDLEERDFNLGDCVQGALKTIALRAEEKGLALLCDIESGVPEMLKGDSGRLRQVLLNLLGNALKFTVEGRVGLRVAADRFEPGFSTLHFIVSDSGVGIAPEKLDMIFDSFSQADASTTRRFGGTGLGLTISRRLVEMMGGRMWVESEPGVGSHFHFTVRLSTETSRAPEAQNPLPVSMADCSIGDDEDSWKTLNILLAEDNRVNQKVASRLLEKRGHHVVIAENGAETLAALAQQSFDLVLMDVHMPGMDGFEATLAIRGQEKVTGLHQLIFAMTALAMKGDRERCLAVGMDGYLSKPIDLEQLDDLLAACAAGRPLSLRQSELKLLQGQSIQCP